MKGRVWISIYAHSHRIINPVYNDAIVRYTTPQ